MTVENLQFLNEHHRFSVDAKPASSPTLRARIRRTLGSWVGRRLFGPYFDAEAEYQMHLVQHLNDMTAQVADLKRQLERSEALRIDELPSSLDCLALELRRETETSVHGVAHEVEVLKSREEERRIAVDRVDGVTRGLERILAGFAPPEPDAPATPVAPRALRYLLLENRYRGSEQAIRERLSIYPAMFAGSTLPVVEIGCGRGELQRLFREAGVKSYGLELDEGMVEVCRSDGFEVFHEDALAYLDRQAPGSLGGIVAVQVIEHMPYDTLKALVRLCGDKVAPGGRIVFETIDTSSMVALCRNYFRDPTHAWPLHPETTRTILEYEGLEVSEIRRLSPFPPSALLPRIEADDFYTPRWQMMVEKVNQNFERLNELLFGHQDYCIIAQAPQARRG